MSSGKAPKGVRFAPSPTGRFHVGNLRTGWISGAWARALREPWIVRFEDIDGPRSVPGAAERQLEDLRALGLEPDRVLVQSEARARHWELFRRAVHEGCVYACVCSRKEVKDALEGAASAPHAPVPIYSGACRGGCDPARLGSEPIAWRFREVDPSGREDFIVGRAAANGSATEPIEASFTPAYHWACAVDDFDGDYRLLVRAHDLSVAVAPQRAIQRWLAGGRADYRPPAIFHASLVVEDDGHRLEKRARGVTLPELAERGVSPRELIARFAKSFDRSRLAIRPEPGSLHGETAETLTLARLGLSILG